MNNNEINEDLINNEYTEYINKSTTIDIFTLNHIILWAKKYYLIQKVLLLIYLKMVQHKGFIMIKFNRKMLIKQ